MAKRQENRDRSQRADSRGGKEALLLWAILGEGGEKEVSRSALDGKGMLPSGDKAAREGLSARGLITVKQRKGYWMSVTEAGFAWAEENLATMPARAQAAAPILRAWLARLSIFLQARNIHIREFLGQHRDVATEPGDRITDALPTSGPPTQDYEALRARIRQAYLDLTEGKLNKGVPLTHLREKLKDVDRASLDEALNRMHLEEGTTLSGLNNPREITPAMRNGALAFKGEPMYVLWITK